MFGKYFKHVLILTLLAGIAYSLPQVQNAMAGAFSVEFSTNLLEVRSVAAAAAAVPSAKKPVVCPAGYTCTPWSAIVTKDCPSGYICTLTNPTSKSSITVMSPNGGETYGTNDVIEVSYSRENLSDTLKVYLYHPKYGNVAEATGLYGSPLGTGKGTINIGQLKNTPPYYTGQFKVTLCDVKNTMPNQPGKPLCDSSDNYFTIISTTTQSSATITSGEQTNSVTPVISGKASGVKQVGVVLSNNGGKVYGSGLIRVTDGLWSVTVSPALSAGQYVVTVYDANNNKLTTGNLNIVTRQAPISFSSLNVSADSASPEAGIVIVDAQNDTDNVTLLVGKIKVEGSLNVSLPELPITLITNGDSLAAVANSLTLRIGNNEYTESVNLSAVQSGVVTFDNLDLTLNPGQTYTFTVRADINNINNSGVTATDFDEGDNLSASLISANMKLADNVDKSGTATGENQEFRLGGMDLSLVSADVSATQGPAANDDIGMFTIKFKATAIGGDVYLPSSTNMRGGYLYQIDRNGSPVRVALASATVVNNTDTTQTSNGNYMIQEGESETLTLTVSLPLGGSGLTSGMYRMSLNGIGWDSSDATSPTKVFNSNMDTFKTSYIVLN